jgi:O-antigen/teichoic acid export membrane protein
MRSVKLMTLALFLGFIVEKQLEVFVLNFYSMPLDAGLYNAGFILGVSTMGLVPGVLSGIILPVMARAGAASMDEQAEKYREFARYLVLLAVPVVCYGIGLSVEIIDLVFGAEYSRSAIAFAVVLAASGITVVVHSANSVLMTRDMQDKVLRGVAMGAVINITIDFIAIPRYGMWGALAGFVVTLLFISGYNTRLASRRLGTRLEWGYYLRVLLVGAALAVPFVLLKTQFPAVVSIFIGGALYVGLFVGGLYLAGLLREQDRATLRHLSGRIPGLNRLVVT